MIAFLHPWFLLGLAGLAVPVVLHLMNREIPLPQVFPSIRFIRKGHLPREGHRRLQDILLLALRLLLLAAIVLTLSRPVWRPRPEQAGGTPAGAGVDLVFLVDASASMQGWDGLAKAREAVAATLDRYPGAEVGLVLSADRVLRALPPSPDAAVVRAAVAELAAEPVRGDPAPALAQAVRLLRPERRRVLAVVSDFQRPDWQTAALTALPPGVTLELSDVNPQRGGNVGVAGVSSRPLSPGLRHVVVEVRNYGLDTAQRTLEVRAGAETQSRPVSVEPLQAKRVAFSVKTQDVTRGEAVLTADTYPLDDSYSVWLGEAPPVRLLAVVPQAAEPDRQVDAFFVQKALQATTGDSGPRFVLDRVEAEHFFALDLADVRGILLLGAAGHFGDGDFAVVRRYLEQGGLVICTPGEAASQQFRALQQQGLLAAEFVGTNRVHSRVDPPFALEWVDPESALGRLFQGDDRSDLFLFPIYRYVRVRPGEAAHALLRIGDHDPVLLEQEVGKGRLFALTVAFDLRWSDLPASACFVPLLRELLGAAEPVDGGVRHLECGQDLPVQSGASPAAARGPAATPSPAPDTRRPGVIVVDGVPFEVNVPRRESVVEKVDLDGLRSLLLSPAAAATAVGAGTGAEAAAPRDRQAWPACAMAAAALLLVELLLAGLLERRDALPGPPS